LLDRDEDGCNGQQRTTDVHLAFELIPHKLVYGGDALGHHDGRPVFVPRALPGERVEVDEVRVAKGAVHGRLLRVLEASPERIEPPCPYYGRCGGCHYQHISPQRQGEVKSEILRETLRRIGKITWNEPIPVHAGHPWNYRNQAQLKVGQLVDGTATLGFYEAESHRPLGIDSCAILSPRLNAVLEELHQPPWSSRIASCREIELLADDRDERVAITLRGNIDHAAAEALATALLAEVPGVTRVAVGNDGQFRVFGEPRFEYAVGDFRYAIGPGSFFQVSRFLLPELLAVVTNGEAGGLALDLFAGVGLFTLPLARRFEQVVAVDADPVAAAALKENAAAHSLANVRTVSSSTEEFLRRFAQGVPDLVILDPPRAGVGAAVLDSLLKLRPGRIHYVSCSPPTLARDLGHLMGHGHELNSVELFDFFPQTYHIESLARLTRRSA
jgi:23S rRNA (uracil1939-C5)-methyltransferase